MLGKVRRKARTKSVVEGMWETSERKYEYICRAVKREVHRMGMREGRRRNKGLEVE